jgi:hypothetical protein
MAASLAAAASGYPSAVRHDVVDGWSERTAQGRRRSPSGFRGWHYGGEDFLHFCTDPLKRETVLVQSSVLEVPGYAVIL